MLGADSGLTVQGREQSEEVVGRQEEEEGNWKMWVGNANFMVGDTLGAWMWAGQQQPCLWSSHVGWGEGTEASLYMLLSLPPMVVTSLPPLHGWGCSPGEVIILPKVTQLVGDTVDSNLNMFFSKSHALNHHPNLPPHRGVFLSQPSLCRGSEVSFPS